MPSPFTLPAWGAGGWGSTAFGGSVIAGFGGHIPASPPFDIYNVAPGPEMAAFGAYIEVQEFALSGQFGTDPTDGDFLMESGGVLPSSGAYFFINTAVPDVYTFETTILFSDLPGDFNDIVNRHAYVGVVDAQGCCFGLFFSLLGIVYTGSVEFGPGNVIKLSNTTQVLPNSLGLISEGTYYTFRVAIDSNTKTAYIYITETALISVTGHQLKYILPAFTSNGGVFTAVTDGTTVSVKGTAAAPVAMDVAGIALGTGLIIPNLPPVADPGKDQSVRACSIVRFDGRASFDPEGAPLVYKWRLIDGPDVSSFVWPAHDGNTHAVGLTNKLFSATLADVNATTPIVAGDVLLVEGTPYNITLTGIDGTYGFYVQIDGFDLSGTLVSANVKLLKQNALSNPTTAQPSFFPDVQGIFHFDLTVFDGGVYSLPEVMIVNVVDSPVPRGLTPDLSFLWNYLSDFWKLVDNTDVIQTFWGALAQIAASELLTLWQHEYGKSLRDIQRTFQRRWLHYDLYIREPFPEQTKTQAIYAGVQTSWFPYSASPAPAAGYSGSFLIRSPLFPDFTVFISPNEDPVSADAILAQIRTQVLGLDKRFDVQYVRDSAGAFAAFFFTAPFPFSIESLSTPLWNGGQIFTNTYPHGTDGVLVGPNTYAVGGGDGVFFENLFDVSAVKDGDYLIIDDVAYRIARVVPRPAGAWPGQRIVTYDEIPLGVGSTWSIVRGTTSSYLDFYNSLCSKGDIAIFEIINVATNDVTFLAATVLSAAKDGKTSLLVDPTTLSPFLCKPFSYEVYFHSIYRRTYMPLDPLVVEVPALQEKIKNTNESAVLRQNVDYFVETYRGRNCLRFVTGTPDVWQNDVPPQRMWAETTFIDNRPTIEGNFGLLAEFTLDDLSKLPSNADYLSIVRGLWYAYFNGPTLYNLRAGTQILLGLPYAEETGTIVEIRSDFSTTTGRILVQDASAQEIVRSYTYPAVLELEVNPDTKAKYKVGDTVRQFAPLVTGVEVTDYIKDPRWFEGYLNQGVFLEVEKFFKFLVRIDSEAFSLETLVFAQSFIKRIKPTYTYPLFVVIKKLPPTTIDTTDTIQYITTLHINDWIQNFHMTDSGIYGHVGGAYDDPRTAWGGWRGKFDGDEYDGPSPGLAPTYPTSITPIHWGFDRDILAPSEFLYGTLTQTLLAPTTAAYDSILSFDLPTLSKLFGVFGVTTLLVPGPLRPLTIKLGEPQTLTVTGNITTGLFQFRAMYPLSAPLNLVITVHHNGGAGFTNTVTIPAGYKEYISPLPVTSFPVVAGDTLDVVIATSDNDIPLPGGGRFFVAYGDGTTWTFDSTVPAGTYKKPRMM